MENVFNQCVLSPLPRSTFFCSRGWYAPNKVHWIQHGPSTDHWKSQLFHLVENVITKIWMVWKTWSFHVGAWILKPCLLKLAPPWRLKRLVAWHPNVSRTFKFRASDFSPSVLEIEVLQPPILNFSLCWIFVKMFSLRKINKNCIMKCLRHLFHSHEKQVHLQQIPPPPNTHTKKKLHSFGFK